jgi:apolipoprotein N-acyltransferase
VRLPLRAWSRGARAIAAALHALSRASLPALALAAYVHPERLELESLGPSLALLAALPAAAAWLLGHLAGVELELRSGELVIHGRGARTEVPLASIAAVEPWRLPLPSAGLALRLRSGRRLAPGLGVADPAPLLDTLAAAGVASAAGAAVHPALVHARARAADRGGAARRPLIKWLLFPLLPTAVFFRAHQHIAYGGTFGQYYLEGLAPYLQTLAFYWATLIAYLVLYTGVWRALAEATAFAAAIAAPSRAARVRRVVERVCLAAYYAGVPALTALRFLA